MTEEALEPDLPIIDPHHHLWDTTALSPTPDMVHPFGAIRRQSPRYLFEELFNDCRESGHNVVGTVFLQCHSFYRADGPDELKPVGEVEYVNGVAARSASGLYGPFRACAGIVGQADLTLGSAVGTVLDAAVAAGNGRFRGIRHIGAHDPDPDVLGPLGRAPASLYSDSTFREGLNELGKRGLTFDAWVLEPQLHEVISLARDFPEQPIVLNHAGTPLGLGVYQGRRQERFAGWKAAITELASCPNVTVKLGGLAMPFCALDDLGSGAPMTSVRLAELFRPYLETCIEAFGASRAMFESNFPVDRWGADYTTLWNAFKLIAQGASTEEKSDLFAGAAARFYSVEHVLNG